MGEQVFEAEFNSMVVRYCGPSEIDRDEVMRVGHKLTGEDSPNHRRAYGVGWCQLQNVTWVEAILASRPYVWFRADRPDCAVPAKQEQKRATCVAQSHGLRCGDLSVTYRGPKAHDLDVSGIASLLANESLSERIRIMEGERWCNGHSVSHLLVGNPATGWGFEVMASAAPALEPTPSYERAMEDELRARHANAEERRKDAVLDGLANVMASLKGMEWVESMSGAALATILQHEAEHAAQNPNAAMIARDGTAKPRVAAIVPPPPEPKRAPMPNLLVVHDGMLARWGR